MQQQYLSILVTFIVTGAVVGLMVSLGRLLGPTRPSAIKGESFECGNPSTGSAWGRFAVKFYLTAILFIVFDVEVVFLYPYAIVFRRLGWFGFVEVLIFASVLLVALLYVWRKGALEWD
jgi:NADH-quinone oxidoreductase subunit A